MTYQEFVKHVQDEHCPEGYKVIQIPGVNHAGFPRVGIIPEENKSFDQCNDAFVTYQKGHCVTCFNKPYIDMLEKSLNQLKEMEKAL